MRPDRSVLGMMLPGSSTLPQDDPRLGERAEAAGSRAVELVAAGVRPEQVLTREAFAVALRALAAVGGSTNAVLHLCAIAGRRMVPLALDDFDAAARTTPVLADVAPIGRHTIAAFDAAGGLQEVLRRLAEPTATPADRDEPAHRTPADGRTSARRSPAGRQAIRDVADPVTEQPALVVLRGNLAPDGAILKAAAGRPELLRHTEPAVVFHGYADLLARIDDPGLDVTADSVLVLTGCGPRGGDGFPEWGLLPIPTKLAGQGVRDMVRISDARMSGTSFGTCILHVAPEAAVGGRWPPSATETWSRWTSIGGRWTWPSRPRSSPGDWPSGSSRPRCTGAAGLRSTRHTSCRRRRGPTSISCARAPPTSCGSSTRWSAAAERC